MQSSPRPSPSPNPSQVLLQQIAATRNYAEHAMAIQAAITVKQFAVGKIGDRRDALRTLLLQVAVDDKWVEPYVMEALARVISSFPDWFNDTLLGKLLEHIESSGDLGHVASDIWLALAPQTQVAVIVALLDVFAVFAPKLEDEIVHRLVAGIAGLARPRRMYGRDPIRESLVNILQRTPSSPSGAAARARLALSKL